MALVLKHATLSQLGQEFRRRYRSAVGQDAARLAKWLLDRISDGTFTENQVRTFFGLTLVQWNVLKTKMQTAASHYDAVLSEAGE